MGKLKFALVALFISIAVTVTAKAPKYIFFFIGDGTGMGQVMTAEAFNRDVLGQPRLLMTRLPVFSASTTYSANSPITDSAAGGTALATGHKTNNGMVGVRPDTTPVYSIAKLLKDKGYGIAIASTDCPDDATPASFYAHQPSRGMFYEIGKDLAASDYDFFAGKALRGTRNAQGQPNDLIPTIEKAGYTIAYGLKGYEASKKAKKLILLSDDTPQSNNIGYAIDSVAGRLTLPFITRACIEHEMMVSPGKFFVMVENGNVDHACHANDGASAVKEALVLDSCVQVAYDFYLRHPDETLILITADHETGGFALGANGARTNLGNIAKVRVSKERFTYFCDSLAKAGKPVDWSWMKDVLKDKFGFFGAIPVSAQREAMLKDAFDRSFVSHDGATTKTIYGNYSQFVTAVFQTVDHYVGFGWTTNGHTGNPVPIMAVGAGSELLNGMHNNVEIPNVIRTLCGIPAEKCSVTRVK